LTVGIDSHGKSMFVNVDTIVKGNIEKVRKKLKLA
jgi:hypothetical protein